MDAQDLRRGICAGIVAVLLLPLMAEAQVSSALLREGEDLLPGEAISALNNTAVNHVGGYACSLNTVGADTISRIWGNPSGGPGTLMRSEGTFGDLEQTSFESFYGMGDAGELAYSPSSNNTNSGATGLDGVWLDDTVVLNEEDAVPSLPGQFSSFNSRPTATGDGVPWWVGGITVTQGGSTQVRVLFSGLSADVVLMGGDAIAGVPEVVKAQAIDFDFRVSRLGSNWIEAVDVESGGTTDDGVIVINGAAVMAGGSVVREASPVPAAAGGLPGELWDNFDFLGITESGSYLITGDTDADIALDEFVLVDGQIVLREGDLLDLGGTPVTIAGAIEGGYMNDQGDWAVTWDVETAGGNIEALIFDGQILVAEGDLVDWNGDGVIDAGDQGAVLTDFTGISSLTVGARQGNTVPIYFVADVNVNATTLEGFFCVNAQVAGPTIPTVSEWGLIVMTLLLLAAATIAFARPRQLVAASGAMPVATEVVPLHGGLFGRILVIVLGLTAMGVIGATWLSGPLAAHDLIGTAISAPLAAYVIHLWIVYAKEQ